MRAAIYARVSTFDQTVDNQLFDLRRYIEARGWTSINEYVDVISGAKDRRPGLDDLVRDARRRKFDAVVVWKLDRLGRSLRHLVLLMEELQQLGVALVSLTDAAYALRASHSTLKTSSESGPSRQSSGQPGLFGERRRVVLLELRQRPPEVWEIVGVQNLDASGVVAIERCGASGAPGVRPIDGRVKPQSEVVGVDRFRDGVE